MKARVIESMEIGFSGSNVNLQGNVYDVHEVVGTRVTINYPHKTGRYIDLTLNEVELLVQGRNVGVCRNQGTRNGSWIGFKKGKGYALRYAMPSGKSFINICKNPFNLEDYTTISEDKFKALFNQ